MGGGNASAFGAGGTGRTHEEWREAPEKFKTRAQKEEERAERDHAAGP